MNAADATREIYWNVTHVWVMYALLLPTAAVAAYGVSQPLSRWRRGRPAARFDRPAARLRLLLEHAVAQRRTARDSYAGLFHQFVSYGFVVLTIATTVVALDADFGTAIMRGRFSLYFQSFVVDLFGALVMVGVLLAAARRHFRRPEKLVYTREATLILAAVFVICLQGFLVEGWRIAATNNPWRAWSPFGNLVARASRPLMTDGQMRAAHLWMWWFHLVSVLGFVAWVPYTKLMHVFTAPLNIYACTECGRCNAACPAHAVGKELSPRDIILQLRDLLHERPRDAFGLVSGVGAGAGAVGASAGTTPADGGPTADVEAR